MSLLSCVQNISALRSDTLICILNWSNSTVPAISNKEINKQYNYVVLLFDFITWSPLNGRTDYASNWEFNLEYKRDFKWNYINNQSMEWPCFDLARKRCKEIISQERGDRVEKTWGKLNSMATIRHAWLQWGLRATSTYASWFVCNKWYYLDNKRVRQRRLKQWGCKRKNR